MTSTTLTENPVQATAPTSATPTEEFRDLGFGTEVAKGTRRLLNRDGTFNVTLEGLDPLSSMSLYHWLLTISWPKFLASISAIYLVVNGLFAFAYLGCGPD